MFAGFLYKPSVETLITKLALNRKSFRLGRRGLIFLLILWVGLLVSGSAQLVWGSIDNFTVAPTIYSAAFLALVVADLLHGTLYRSAMLLRLAGFLAVLVGTFLVLAHLYFNAGAFWAIAATVSLVLVSLLVFYLQRRLGEP